MRFELFSAFSEVGPHWNVLSLNSTSDSGWAKTPEVTSRGDGRWMVTAEAKNYTLTRVLQLDPWPGPPWRVLVNDTITSLHQTAPIGLFVRHSAAIAAGGEVAHAVVPGILNPSKSVVNKRLIYI